MSGPVNRFSSLRIEGWRQFDNIDIELHPRLTVLTGANGAGKSTILRLFSRHFGFDRPLLATPRLERSGAYSYSTGIFTSLFKTFTRTKQNVTDIGTLVYKSGQETSLQVPAQNTIQYSISIERQQNIKGLHIDSHQPISPYQTVVSIPTTLITPETAYNNYHGEISNKYQGGHTGLSPVYRMKEALIAMAMFGEGNTHVKGNESILAAYTGFSKILQQILPPTLGFINIEVRPPEVVLITKSGDFLIDAASGGVMTLIDMAWRLYMFSLNHADFVVTMDEPENHLHPTMQRSLMRRFLSAFPQAQFIIATHSPFMVSSVKDSNVYVLKYVERGSKSLNAEQVLPSSQNQVVSVRLDTVNKAGNASEILREVLGVSATVPEWVEEGLNEIVARYRGEPITGDSLKSLRRELSMLGYDELYPDALASLTKKS